jgi:hypothetical protein
MQLLKGRIASFVVLSSVVSCVSIHDELNMADYVTAEASRHFHCDKDNINVDKTGSKTFAATGCNKSEIYICEYANSWYQAANLQCRKQAQAKSN